MCLKRDWRTTTYFVLTHIFRLPMSKSKSGVTNGSAMRGTMKTRHVSLCLVLALSAVFVTGLLPAHAASIYVDLNTHWGTPSSAYGGPAAVAGTWNGIPIGTTSNLLDITGAATSVSVTVTFERYGNWTSTGSDRDKLFADHMYGSTDWSVAFSGLADGPYDIYLCAPDHVAHPTGDMTVNGSPVSQIQTGFTTVTTQVRGGTLSIEGEPSTTTTFGLAGVQVSRVPAPPAILLLASGFVGLIGVRKKFKK